MHNNIPESDGSIFQDGGHFQHKNHFLDGFLQTCAILMILVSNHTFLTMQNPHFDLRNSVKAYLTKYETKSCNTLCWLA